MQSKQELARIALRAAFDVRRKVGTLFEDPICVYDFVEQLNLEVWFVGGASFGGMYAKEMGRLFVPSERPAGRRAFTCAHELAHWWFDHGTKIDALDFDKADHEVEEENLANLFASYLLMPRHAVVDAFKRRNIVTHRCNPVQLYSIACQLGVGFSTLVKHMRYSLNLMEHARMNDLLAVTPKSIRSTILGGVESSHLVVADGFWRKVAIDLEVGDYAIIPRFTKIDSSAMTVVGECSHGLILQARLPGLVQAVHTSDPWAAMIRVSRRQYMGRGVFRHLHDPDETA